MALEPRFDQGTWETAPTPGEEQSMQLVFSSVQNSSPPDDNNCGSNGRPLTALVFTPDRSDSKLVEMDFCLEATGESAATGTFTSPTQTGRYELRVQFFDANGDRVPPIYDIGFMDVQEPLSTQPVSATVSCQGVSDLGDAIEVQMRVDPDGVGVARVPISVAGQQVWEQTVQSGDGSQTTTTALIPKGLLPQGANQPVEIPTQV